MAFHVGQKVVCVDDGGYEGARWEVGSEIKKGSIYTIREIGVTVGKAELGFRLHEVILSGKNGYYSNGPYTDCFYLARRFRPIVEKSTDTGMAILREILDRETIRDREPVKQ